MNLAQIFRKIQHLKSSSKKEDLEELNFYEEVIKLLLDSLTPKGYMTMEQIHFSVCPVERAKELASENGLHIVEGASKAVYLSWARGINDPED